MEDYHPQVTLMRIISVMEPHLKSDWMLVPNNSVNSLFFLLIQTSQGGLPNLSFISFSQPGTMRAMTDD